MMDMKQNKLDLKDRRILYQLDINARQSNAEIAKKVGLSKDVVNYRIKKLEKTGFIKGYYTVIDFSRLGYFSVRLYLKLIDTTPQKEKDILNFLINHNKTFFVAETEGPWDITIETWVKSIYEFEDFYMEFKKRFKQYIGDDQMSIFTKAHHFHRAYILNKQFDESKPEYFGKEEKVQYDRTDMLILKSLAKNSRIPIIEISTKLNIPPRTVAFRIKQLEKKKIIQGYRFIFDFELFGYTYYKVDVILKEILRIKELMSFAHRNPNIIYIDETIGGADFEFDLEVKGKNEFLGLMNKIRTKFPEIRSHIFFTLRRYCKLLYFPES